MTKGIAIKRPFRLLSLQGHLHVLDLRLPLHRQPQAFFHLILRLRVEKLAIGNDFVTLGCLDGFKILNLGLLICLEGCSLLLALQIATIDLIFERARNRN